MRVILLSIIFLITIPLAHPAGGATLPPSEESALACPTHRPVRDEQHARTLALAMEKALSLRQAISDRNVPEENELKRDLLRIIASSGSPRISHKIIWYVLDVAPSIEHQKRYKGSYAKQMLDHFRPTYNFEDPFTKSEIIYLLRSSRVIIGTNDADMSEFVMKTVDDIQKDLVCTSKKFMVILKILDFIESIPINAPDKSLIINKLERILENTENNITNENKNGLPFKIFILEEYLWNSLKHCRIQQADKIMEWIHDTLSHDMGRDDLTPGQKSRLRHHFEESLALMKTSADRPRCE